MKPFINELMNATALAFDPQGMLYISSRYDGIVYQVTPNGNMSRYVEGMGVATGIAFDAEQNLYVGDRSGTIFKISPDRQIFVFATLEPSISAYHLAFGPDGYLYVTGPTTSSFDSRLPHLARRRGRDLLPRPRPSAGHGVRRGGPPLRRRLARRPQGRRAHLRRTAAPTCSSPAPASSASPSRRRARWSSPPPTPSIASTSASRAARSSDERRNHRSRHRRC